MAKKDSNTRRLKGYYKFSKKYPSRHGDSYAIGESRKMKKKERTRKIVFAVILCCVFALSYVAVAVGNKLSDRPINESDNGNEPVISIDNIGTVRALYVENAVLDDLTNLSKTLSKAKKDGFNAVMLDFKMQDGTLAFNTNLLKNTNKSDYNAVDSLIVEKIKDEGLMVIARVFCFEDTTAPQRIGAYVYENAEKTKIWFDDSPINGGRVWLNPADSKATDYLCKVIGAISKAGADCIYLQSVQFPEARQNSIPVFTENDGTLNRNIVLMQFLENAVKSAGVCPVILGIPVEGVNDGNQEKWGGALFDTAASVCSPVILPSDGSDYVKYVSDVYTVMNDRVKNNFSTIKVIPTLKKQGETDDFYKRLASENVDSYIILP